MSIDLKDYEEILDPTFDSEGDGIAICHKMQGYSANGWGERALMLKSLEEGKKKELYKALRQVTVTLSFEEFLRKFFDMWYDDAEFLAKLLGFQTEWEYDTQGEDFKGWEEYLEEKVSAVTLMKSVKTEEDFFNLSYEDQEKITSVQERFEKGLLSGNFSEEAEGLNKAKNINVDTKANSDNGDNNNMSDEIKDELMKAQQQLEEMRKEWEKEKSAREALEAKEAEKFQASIMKKANKLSFIEEGKAEEFVGLVKSADAEVVLAVFDQLEKAQSKIAELEKQIEEADPMTKSMSAAGEDQDASVDMVKSKVTEKIKAMNSK